MNNSRTQSQERESLNSQLGSLASESTVLNINLVGGRNLPFEMGLELRMNKDTFK